MVATAIAGISAAAGLASAGSSLFRSNSGAVDNSALQNVALQQSAATQYEQQLIDALINQRSVAGQTDSFGTSLQYDPTTNQWTTTYGTLPQQAMTAQMQAGINRNTYDQRQADLANQQSALAATRAEPLADTARRNLETYRPMSSDELVGLLQQQASSAQAKTWNPLIADTLRSMARSGTAAEPVLGKLGTDEAQSLRDSLVDAQIKGMTNVGTINQQRQSTLEDAATKAQTLATPSFQYPSISGSGVDNTMAQVAASRATSAATAPAYGMSGLNTATGNTQSAAKTAGSASQSADSANYGINALSSAAKSLGQLTSSSGDVTNFIKSLTSGSGSGSESQASKTYTADSGAFGSDKNYVSDIAS